VLLAVAIALLAGCDAGRQDAPGFMVRDSAGIRITESAAPVWSGGGGWVVVELPARLAVQEIGADYVMGVHTDDLGVESVKVYTLEKGQANP